MAGNRFAHHQQGIGLARHQYAENFAEAFAQGHRAYGAGQWIDRNPYPSIERDGLYSGWRTGWRAAAAERRRSA
jgi:ribosome modulation factor